MNIGRIVFQYLFLLTLVCMLVLASTGEDKKPAPTCHTMVYTQRGRWQNMQICVGDSVKIQDTGLASRDSLFMQKFVQPVIDSLKQTRE